MGTSWRSRQRLFERGEGDDGEHVGDRLDDEARGNRRAVVMEDRNEAGRIEIAFADQQGPQLRVAVLLDNKNPLVAGDKIEDVVMEREGADTHRVDMDAAVLERVERFGHRRGGRTEIQRAK